MDPFDQLMRKRIEDALKILTATSRSTNPAGRSRAHWTPEQREAASQQMKERWAKKRQQLAESEAEKVAASAWGHGR